MQAKSRNGSRSRGRGNSALRAALSPRLAYQSATMPRNLRFFLGRNDLDLFWRESECFESSRGGGPNVVAMLADAAGKGEKIDTTEQSDVGPDLFSHRNRKDIERQRCRWITRTGSVLQGSDVALTGRESKQAALAVEQIFQLVGAEILVADEIDNDTRIEIAGTRAHRNASGRREAHGGVNGDSVAQGAQAGPVAQVREDRPLGKLRTKMMHQRFVGDSMKAVTANARVVISLRQRQVRCYLGHGLVKRIVEASIMRRGWERLLCSGNQRQRLRDV